MAEVLERIKAGAKLCEQWGLDANDVTSITLELDGHQVLATIRRIVKDSELPGFLEAIDEYELAPKGWREMMSRG